jgi:hypothetical protein
MKQQLEKFVDGGEREGRQEQRSKAACEKKTGRTEPMVHWFRRDGHVGNGAQQAIDARGEVAVAGEKRSREIG